MFVYDSDWQFVPIYRQPKTVKPDPEMAEPTKEIAAKF